MYPGQTLGFTGAGILGEQPGRGLEPTFQTNLHTDPLPTAKQTGCQQEGAAFCSTPPSLGSAKEGAPGDRPQQH